MNVERHAVSSPQGMFAVRKNFHAAKKAAEQAVQACPRKKIPVVALEQMPGHDAPVIQIRKQFQVRDREKRAATDDPRDLGSESLGIFCVLEDLDANGAIVFAVRAWQASGCEIDSTKRQATALENFTAMIVRFQAEPTMPGRD